MFKPYYQQHLLLDKIQKKRHRHFMRETAPHFIGAYVTSWLMFFIFKQNATMWQSTLWLVALHFLVLVSAGLYYLYYFKKDFALTVKTWGWLIQGLSVAWGVFLAAAPVIYTFGSSVNDVFIMCMIIGSLAAVPAPALVHYLSSYILFITLPLIAITAMIYNLEQQLHTIVYWLTPFMLVSLYGYGYSLYRNKLDLIIIGIEKEQAMLAKSKFMAAVSYDFFQPLQRIKKAIHGLKNKHGELELDGDKNLLQVDKQINSMTLLIDDLLLVSKLDANEVKPKPTQVPLKPICEQILKKYSTLAQQKHLMFAASLNDVSAWVDPLLFEHVIDNLLSNAVRYSQQGQISMMLDEDTSGAVLVIVDEGIGISVDNQKAVFAEYYQVQGDASKGFEGLGIGLSIVRRLCSLQSWDINLRSTLGKGTSVSLTCPLQAPASLRRNE